MSDARHQESPALNIACISPTPPYLNSDRARRLYWLCDRYWSTPAKGYCFPVSTATAQLEGNQMHNEKRINKSPWTMAREGTSSRRIWNDWKVGEYQPVSAIKSPPSSNCDKASWGLCVQKSWSVSVKETQVASMGTEWQYPYRISGHAMSANERRGQGAGSMVPPMQTSALVWMRTGSGWREISPSPTWNSRQ